MSVAPKPATTVGTVAPTTVPTTVQVPILTVPPVLIQFVQPVTKIAATIAELIDRDGARSEPLDATALGFVVECAESCVLRITDVSSVAIEGEMAIVDDVVSGSVVIPNPTQVCLRSDLTFTVDLRFTFPLGSAVPTSAVGTVSLDVPMVDVDRSTTCLGSHGVWDIDTALVPVP